MVDPLLLALFVAATVGFIMTPGPIVSLIVAETLEGGWQRGIAIAVGASAGVSVFLTINYFGYASIAALPAWVLAAVRYIGAVFLYYLAWRAFTSPPKVPTRADEPTDTQAMSAHTADMRATNTGTETGAGTETDTGPFSHTASAEAPFKNFLWRNFRRAFLICLTSPKAILFFAAFLPQFISDAYPAKLQLVILSLTFIVVAFMMDSGWIFAAHKARTFLHQKNKIALVGKISGTVLALGATMLLLINP